MSTRSKCFDRAEQENFDQFFALRYLYCEGCQTLTSEAFEPKLAKDMTIGQAREEFPCTYDNQQWEKMLKLYQLGVRAGFEMVQTRLQDAMQEIDNGGFIYSLGGN